MARKQIIIDGVTYDLGADSQNVDYTNEDMEGVTNAEGALDNLNERVGNIENPPEAIVAEYTEADATIIGKKVSSQGTLEDGSGYKCTGLIPIPVGVKMFVKTNYAFTGTLCMPFYRYSSNVSNYNFGLVKAGGPYSDWTEIHFPDYANYFRFTLPNNSSYHIAIKFVAQPSIDVVKLKVASWNIEAFDEPPVVTNANVAEKRKAFRELFDSVNADIICFSEFRTQFNRDDENSTAANEILGNYPYKRIGKFHDSYNFNVIVSKLPIIDSREFDFTTRTNGGDIKQGRYWKEATIRINGKDVKIVASHFDYQNKTYQTAEEQAENYEKQFQQIVAHYKDEPYVIIGADFNVHTWDRNGVHKFIDAETSDENETYISGEGTDGYLNYQYFVDAGYTLMNFDYLTLVNPKDGGTTVGDHTADNIAVKGFAMGAREYVPGTYGLSDHPMVACELIML